MKTESTTEHIKRYRQLAQKLLYEQANNMLSIIEESHILEEMDECWYQMSDDERAEIERNIAEAKKAVNNHIRDKENKTCKQLRSTPKS